MKCAITRFCYIFQSFLFICFFVSGCGDKAAESEGTTAPPVPVITTVVAYEVVRRPVVCQGIVHPVRQEKLFFRAGGKIAAIHKPEGSRVAEGDTIATLCNPPLTREWVKRGLALIEERNTLYAMKKAREKGQVNRSEYYEQRRRTGILREAYFSANTALYHADLIAPFSGRVVDWYVSVQDSVVLGQPVVLLVETEPSATARVGLSEEDYFHTQVGDSAVVRLADEPGLPLEGTVSSRGLVGGIAKLVYSADILFENPGGIAHIGTRVSVKINQKYEEKAILIPTDALVDRGDGSASVFLTDSKDKFAVRRHVVLGPEIGQKIIIDKGLRVDERVIIHGHNRLEHGTRIIPLP